MKYLIAVSLPLIIISFQSNGQKSAISLESAYQWDKVSLATQQEETKDYFKIDLVTTKATGATVLSSVSNVQNRAIRKLKIATALLGGNLVYLTHDVIDARSLVRPHSRTQLIGSVFTSHLIDTAKFRQWILGSKEFTLISKIGIRNNDARIHTFHTNANIVFIKSYYIERGFIYLNLSIQTIKGLNLPLVSGNKNRDKVRVVSISDNRILVAYKDKSSIYNLLLTRK